MLKDNEKGSTLVMVLLITVVITILGVSLFAMNISASKQFTKKEQQVQARHLAEMGIMHYHNKVDEDVEAFTADKRNYEEYDFITNSDNSTSRILNIERTTENYIRGICRLAHIDGENSISHMSTTGEYKVERTENMTCSDLISNSKKIQVTIESTGIATNVDKTIEAIISVVPLSEYPNHNGDGDSDPSFNEKPQPPTEDVDKRPIFDMEKREEEIVNQNLHIAGNFNIEPGGGNKPNLLKVGKSLYVNGQMAFNNHACIVADGDLTVLGDIDIKNKEKSFIVVYGNAYLGGNLVGNSSDVIYVKGKVYSKSGAKIKSHSDLPNNWRTTCGITGEEPNEPEPNELIWKVNPDVFPDYFPN